MLTGTRSVATSLRRIVVVTMLLAVFYSPAILRAQTPGDPLGGLCTRCYCDKFSHGAFCVDCIYDLVLGTCHQHPWFICDYADIWIAA
jgi:hypothetical protein